jgi:transcriptional regulator with PAS, ATPase and Fis domain
MGMINVNSKEFLQFCHSAFDNIPIAIDFLDKDGKMIYINKAFSDFLQIPIDDMIGRVVTDINPTSKFMISLKNKKADIAVPHKFPTGKEAICHRIPIINDGGNLLGGLGMILFEEIQNMKDILDKYELLDKELKLYKNEVAKLNRTTYGLENIIGKSDSIIKCKNNVKKFAKVKFNTLITGESGVGKELFAHAIHAESQRRDMPFVSINCSAIPENLLESEFFGYEEGAFTGAKKGGSIGKFELANGGTIFLDEIGEMPYYMQAKFLRVLQEKEIVRIGGERVIPLDIRVVCATNKDLRKMAGEGKFREDLYYRINVLNIEVPPLRDRKEDIKYLAQEFLFDFQKESEMFRKISDNIMSILEKYPWPGNVRELKNIISKICVNADNVNIGINDLPDFLLEDSLKQDINLKAMGLNEIISNVEIRTIKSALIQCNYNKTQAAKLLNIPRNTLYRKMKDLNI